MGNRLRSRGYRCVCCGLPCTHVDTALMSCTYRVVEDLDLTHEVATYGPFDVVRYVAKLLSGCAFGWVGVN